MRRRPGPQERAPARPDAPHPAGMRRPDAGRRGRSSQGVPELLVEVSHTTRYTDLGPKLEDYERVGVQEYVVRALEPDAVYWFVLRNGRFVELPPGPDGILPLGGLPRLVARSRQALLRGDRRRLRAVVDLGCATPEHAAFVARLAAAREQVQGPGPA